jgi:hypothetical protein
MVTGRLGQRSWETPEGDKRSVTELEADEVGASLKWAFEEIQHLAGLYRESWVSQPSAAQVRAYRSYAPAGPSSGRGVLPPSACLERLRPQSTINRACPCHSQGLPGLEPGASSLSGFCPRTCFRGSRQQPGKRCTAADRCGPLGSNGMWPKRGSVTSSSDQYPPAGPVRQHHHSEPTHTACRCGQVMRWPRPQAWTSARSTPSTSTDSNS